MIVAISILFQLLLLGNTWPLLSLALFKGSLNSIQIVRLPKFKYLAKITSSTGISLSLGNSFDLTDFLSKYPNKQIAGVYALSDPTDSVLYVGISRNVETSISSLLRNGINAKEHSIRIQTFAVFDVDALKAYQQELIRQLGEVPKYNNPINNEWENFLKDSQVDILADESNSRVNVPLDDAKSNKKILKDTISNISTGSSSSSSSSNTKVDEVDDEPISTIQSPFLNADITDNTKENKPLIGLGRGLDFNIKNVDLVLDEIRPFLISDGGNVAVLGVNEDTRSVELSLQGACGSCPSSTTTMKMGIERILRENFANLGDIVAVNKAADPPAELTKDMILVALNPVLPAVQAMGGKVEVLSVDPVKGGVVLQYKGPAKLKQGIELILKDLSLVNTIEIVS